MVFAPQLNVLTRGEAMVFAPQSNVLTRGEAMVFAPHSNVLNIEGKRRFSHLKQPVSNKPLVMGLHKPYQAHTPHTGETVLTVFKCLETLGFQNYMLRKYHFFVASS